MANDLTSNPLIIDTAGVIYASLRMNVRAIHWDAATTAGHTAEIQDKNGKIKWHQTVPAANNNVQEHFEEDALIFDGLNVSLLQSGKLYIYCG